MSKKAWVNVEKTKKKQTNKVSGRWNGHIWRLTYIKVKIRQINWKILCTCINLMAWETNKSHEVTSSQDELLQLMLSFHGPKTYRKWEDHVYIFAKICMNHQILECKLGKYTRALCLIISELRCQLLRFVSYTLLPFCHLINLWPCIILWAVGGPGH